MNTGRDTQSGAAKAHALLADLLNRGFQFWIEQGQLCFRAPQGALTPSLRKRLQACKPDIVSCLTEGRRYACTSFAQQRLWFLHEYDPKNPAYNMSAGTFLLEGPLDLALLEQVLGRVVERHDALRTTFGGFDGVPVQAIDGRLPVDVHILDLANVPEECRQAEAERVLAQEVLVPFDLANGPVFKARLIRLGPERHILALPMHHIISDAWSLAVIIRDVRLLYEAYAAGTEPSVPEIRTQYADFAQWQRRQLAEGALDDQLAYWRERLSGAIPALEMPTDRPRPTVQTFRGAQQPVRIPRALTDALRQIGRGENATLFMTLLAAFNVLLHRYTNQDDLLVGSPIAGRRRPETHDVVGLFVNTLVLRSDLGGEPGFLEVLRRVRETVLGAFSHQDVPFERLVEELHPDRDMTRNPLFQAMFVLQSSPTHMQDFAGIKLTRLEPDVGTTQFDLMLSLQEDEDGLFGWLRYNADLFDAATAERMVGHFNMMLTGIAEKPERPIASLPMLTDAERHQLLVEWNATQVDYPPNVCLHTLFEAQVARTPKALAVEFKDERLTYRELNQRANQLAHYLRHQGVGPETVVAVGMERSLDLVVALYGVLKAGGAYVPLDPSYPRERRGFMLEDAAVRIILTHECLASDLPDHNACVISVDAVAERIAQEPDENPTLTCSPDNLAYVFFTSGSTGRPKGAMNEHRAICNHLLWMQDAYGLTASDRVLQKIPYSFDVSLYEFFWPLLVGAQLVVSRPGGHRDSAYLVNTIIDRGITTAAFVPSALRVFVEESRVEQCTSLKRVIVIGEALPLDLQERFFERLDCELHNLYGPTEAAVAVTAWRCRRDGESPIVPIGKPIANTQTYITDARRQPVPIGVPGELCLGGVQIGRGYVNRPELTAEVFVHDPFSGREGARLYRTGDLCRYLPDGNIEFLGRIDHQVKLRGHRIELGEIEAVLREREEVSEAVVAVREDSPGHARLVGYVVPGDNGAAHEVNGSLAKTLRSALKDLLPDYMVPSAFVTLDALPLLANGKVNRKSLPAPSDSEIAKDDSYAAPRNPVESKIVELWGELLGVNRTGIHDSFFDLGGHSLLATQLLSRIREEFLVEVSLRTFLGRPTPAHLAELVAEGRLDASGPPQSSIEPVPRDGDLPLSFAQQRLWFLGQMEPESGAYNMPGALALTGRLDVEALERALTEIVRRHESLRTIFVSEDGRPAQRIRPPHEVTIRRIDLSAQDEDGIESRLEEEARRGFDLAEGPLFRAHLFRLGEERHILLVNMHHIVSDGWSLGVLTRELSALYEAYCDDVPSTLPELPIQYADFAQWQRAWLGGEALDAQLAYWRQQLDDPPPPLALPFDRPRPNVQSDHGATFRFSLPAALADALRELSKDQDVTLFMTLLAALKTLLHRYTWESDIVVGCPIANRTRVEIEDLIGFFVNTLVLRTDLGGNPSFLELLKRVRDVTLGAYAHQDVPFEKLVEELHPERDLSRTPFFQVMFVWQNMPSSRFALPGLEVAPFRIDPGTSKLDINVHLEETDQGLEGFIQYNRDLFEADTIAQMVDCFQRLLQSIADDPSAPVSSLPITDRRSIGKAPAVSLDDKPEWGGSIPARFDEQAERHADKAALVTPEDTWTYAQLKSEAERFANGILARGKRPPERVALLFDRAAYAIAAMLGTLKAGAAYIPLDASYPDERLAFMIEDSDAGVLLTDRDAAHGLVNESVSVIHSSEIPPVSARGVSFGSVSPDALAYVLYTSGSTGRPKGVMQNHRNVLHFIRAYTHALDLRAEDRLTLFSALGFDAAVMDVYGALLNGATLIQPNLRHAAPNDVMTWLQDETISIFHSTPTVFRAYVGGSRANDLSRIRAVVLGGEEVRADDVALYHERFRRESILMNLMGSSESSYSMHSFPNGKGRAATGTVPLSVPVRGTEVLLVNEAGEPGQIFGQIAIHSPHVALGYWRRPELTEEVFLTNEAAGHRLYRTGDMGRLLPDGSIAFLGRRDNQVKVRGYRIELGEIENVLMQHPAVREAAVGVRRDASQTDGPLTAYVAAADDAVAELRGFLLERLPDYMLPSCFVALETLPKNANGKTDRKALPEPERARGQSTHTYESPRGADEERLAAIWSELLNVDRIGRQDSFFDLGGHSLLATQLVSRIGRSFGVELPLRVLFETPTLAGVAEALATTDAGRQAASEFELVAAGRGRMSLEDQLDELEALDDSC